jgi:phosphoglycerate-specific signal transduction histidine kinase
MTGSGDDMRKDAASNAESALEAVAQIVQTMAHDLSQPLAAAANYLAVARQIARRQAAEAQSLGEALEKAAAQLTRATDVVRRMRASLATEEPQTLDDLLRTLRASGEPDV